MNTVVSAGRPGRIFISYRRDDAAYAAGWLYDRLSDRFGGGQVFKDVDSLQPGDDFVEKITLAVSSCDVLLAVIGPSWVAAADEQGKLRLGDPDDFVRVEIEAALTRGIRVIPLLVEGARMPRVTEVPPSLSPLIRRHALELSPSRFNRDAEDLMGVLGKAVPPSRQAAVTTSSPSVKSPPGRGALSATSTAPAPDRTPARDRAGPSTPAGEPQRRTTTGSPTRPAPTPAGETTPSGAGHLRSSSAPGVPPRPKPAGPVIPSRAPTRRVTDTPPRSIADETPTAVIDTPPVIPRARVSGAGGLLSSPARSRASRLKAIRGRWWLATALAMAAVLTGMVLLSTSGGLPRSSEPLADDVLVWRPKPAGADYRLATIDVHGQGERALTSDGPHDSSAVLSPDRRTVLFLRSNPQNKYRFTLYAVAADGGRQQKLFADGTPACPELHRPAWSKQGLLAVVCSRDSGRHDLLNLITLDGKLLRTLVPEGELGDPTFTADGASVIYWQNRSGSNVNGGALYQVATDGSSQPVLLTPGAPGQDGDPACSPVSDEIAFRHTSGKQMSIVLIRAGQGQQGYSRQLEVPGHSAQDPAWSPDGSQIIFRSVSNRTTTQLWVMDAQGDTAQPILDPAEHMGPPAWTTR